MKRRRLGTGGPEVGAVGLGCMGMSGTYGATDEGEAVATIQEAIERGVNLLNTGDFYEMGHNESLVRRAIEGRRERAFVSVKFGALRSPDGRFLGFDGRPQAVKNFLSYSLRRLGTDYIDLYEPARVDPAVPIEETVGAIAEMVQAGYVRHVGLSEAAGETVRRAATVHPIAALETEYAVVTRDVEAETLPTVRELGVAVVAYGVLAKGLIGGKASQFGAEGDHRAAISPRFAGENLAHNLQVLDGFNAIAADKGVTPAQLGLAWVLAQGEDVIPLVGAKTRQRLAEALAALDLELTAEDRARIEQAVPVGSIAGERYQPQMMKMLDG